MVSKELQKNQTKHQLPKLQSRVYILIVCAWLLLNSVAILPILADADHQSVWYGGLLLFFNFIFISYFWLNGMKDLFYVLFYYRSVKKRDQWEQAIMADQDIQNEIAKTNPKVALIYVTCNDFIPDALEKSMYQTYSNTQLHILDDSSKKESLAEVESFVANHKDVVLVRRTEHQGFKAGNLNHFLQKDHTWDYCVILDSDEVIPTNFVEQALPFFYVDRRLGILQANHISTRNDNQFMKRFYRGVDAHWSTYQSEKEKFGFLSFLGHGAMISAACYRAVGAFPEVVAEDITFTLEGVFRGFHIRFAKNIICEEQFPVNYMAFVKRQYKWVGGNMEFISLYTKKIFSNKNLRWFQKLDILLFVYNLPLTYIFSIFLAVNIVLFPVLGIQPHYALWLLIPTIVFYFAPMLNDVIHQARYEKNVFKQLKYLVSSMLLYGSVYYTTISSSFMFLIGRKPQFIVTPKNEERYTFWDVIVMNRASLIFVAVLVAIGFLFNHGLSPVILIAIPELSCLYLGYMSNYEHDWLAQEEEYGYR